MKQWLTAFALLALPFTVHAAQQASVLKGGYFTPAYSGPAVQPEGRPTALRGRSETVFHAEKGAAVRFRVTSFQVGTYTDNLKFSILGAADSVLAGGEAKVGQTAEAAFTPPESGVYRLVCDAGLNAAEVEGTNARLCLPVGAGQGISVVGHARRLWFYVPRGSEGFKATICGQGAGETVAVKIFAPDGKEIASGTTAGGSKAVSVNVAVDPLYTDGVWSLQLMKAAEGVFEDAHLGLEGDVGPHVSEKPEDLFMPILSFELPALYRRSSGGPVIMLCSLLAPAHLVQRPMIFVKMLSPETGDELYSEMLFRFEKGATYKVRLPQDKASRGAFVTRITLRSGEEVVYAAEQLVRVVDRPSNLREDNVTLVDGKPFFPRGLYHVRSEDYDVVKQQGFNIVQAGPHQIPDCERAGLKAAVVLYAGMKLDWNYYRENILKYKDSPAVVCWMIMDEPCANRVPVRKTEEAYALIRELDPMRPAYMCICPCRATAYREYGRSTDIIAVDVYPVDRQPLTDIADRIEWARAAVPEQAVWFIGQVWSWPGKPDPKARALVTAAQHRCMSYLALTHNNVRGLGWYSFRDPDWYLPESNPEVWAACKKVNDELIQLEPVLLEKNKWERVVKDDGEIHLCLKPHGDGLYLIAVNPTDKAMSLSLDLSEEKPGPQAVVRFENRAVPLDNGRLTDRFEPLAVHVYEIQRQ